MGNQLWQLLPILEDAKPNRPDWARTSAAIGAELPSDYRRFVEVYGAGAIDGFLWILTPWHPNPNLDLTVQITRQSAALAELRSVPSARIPFPPFDGRTGLIPWGISDNGDICFWLADHPNPDRWSVVVADGRMSIWERFPGTLEKFLSELLTGRWRSEVFEDEWPKAALRYVRRSP